MDTAPVEGNRKYLITGGGTAGHVYPGLALAEGIRRQERDAEFLFVGTRGGAEERIVPAEGHALRTLSVKGLPPGAGPHVLLRTVWFLALSLLQGVGLVLRFKPRAIIGTGGYASAPVLLGAILLRSLRLWKGVLSVHEANIIPGRFNRWASRWVDFTGTSFPETLRFLTPGKALWTGYPIRKDLEASSKRRGTGCSEKKRRLGIPAEGRVVLVFGGSSGARTINRAVVEALPRLLADPDLYVFHATGHPQGDYDPAAEFRDMLADLSLNRSDLEKRYRQTPYLDHIDHYYEIADLVVCRAGAGAVWEVASYSVPAILIPKSNLPGDHQVKNAYFLVRRGKARILFERKSLPPDAGDQDTIDASALVDTISALLADPDPAEDTGHEAEDGPLLSGDLSFCDLLRNLRERKQAGRREEVTAPVSGRQHPSEDSMATRIEWLGTDALLAYVEGKRKHNQDLTEGGKAYLRYKTDQLLGSSLWQERNTGVKLVGLIGYKERLPTLLHFIVDRTPVAWHRRLLGGDFEQVGFIRRNALQAIWRINEYGPDVRNALLVALNDPYYEVRSWAARAIHRLSGSVGEDAELVALLRKNLKDRWFEVVVCSLRALGRVTEDPAILSDLVPLLAHRNWKVQDAAVRCLMRLMQSGVVHLPPEAEEWMHKIPMKGLDFFPRFPLKQTWDDFQRLVSERMECDNPSNTEKGAF